MSGLRRYPAGVPCWVDIECGDVERVQAFYGGLFGWTFVDATAAGSASRYVIAQLDGLDAAGIGGHEDAAAEAGSAAWNTYVAVEDVDTAVRRVEGAGGRVLEASSDLGEGGRTAVCADPSGVRFRLWQPRGRPGAQAVNTPGGWNFSDLHAADAAASGRFYAEVFGWAFDDLGFATMIRLPGYGDHLEATSDPDIRARQGGVEAPPGFEDAVGWLAPVSLGEEPHWHVSFTVADRDATATAAELLGGRVLDRTDTDWTLDALISDPQGGVFTVSQFSPPSG